MMYTAERNDDGELIEVMHSHGANLDEVCNDGKSALFYACEEGYCRCIETLLRLGANVHLQDNSGKRPLSFAVEQGSPKTIDMLIQAGARVEDIDDASVAKLEAIMSTVIH